MSTEGIHNPEQRPLPSAEAIQRYASDLACVRDYSSWMMSFRSYLIKDFEYSELDVDELLVGAVDDSSTYMPTPEDFLLDPEDGLDKARAYLVTDIIPQYDAMMYESNLQPDGRIDKQAYCNWYHTALKSLAQGEFNRHDAELCQASSHDTPGCACDWTALCPLKVLIRQLDDDLLCYPLDDENMEYMSLMPDGVHNYINSRYDKLKCQIVMIESLGLLSLDQARSRLTAATAGRDSMLEHCEERAIESGEVITDGSEDQKGQW